MGKGVRESGPPVNKMTANEALPAHESSMALSLKTQVPLERPRSLSSLTATAGGKLMYLQTNSTDNVEDQYSP